MHRASNKGIQRRLNEDNDVKKGAFLPHKTLKGQTFLLTDYFLSFTTYLAKASPFLSMAYSTVSLAPVEVVLRSVS